MFIDSLNNFNIFNLRFILFIRNDILKVYYYYLISYQLDNEYYY